MKKFLIALLTGFIVLTMLAIGANSQTAEYKTVLISGTADVLMDSTLTATMLKGKRVHINGIYAWWDNGANTNQVFVQVVRGTSALREAGVRRQFIYSEAMTSGGIKAETFTPNITCGPDSTIYFVISAASSDSLFLAVNYKIIND